MESLLLLVLLACPIGMALMMFLMMRRMGGQRDRRDTDDRR